MTDLLLDQGAVLVLVEEREVGDCPGGPQLALPRVAHPQQGDDRRQAAVVDVPLLLHPPPGQQTFEIVPVPHDICVSILISRLLTVRSMPV